MTEYRIVSLKRNTGGTYIVQKKRFWWWQTLKENSVQKEFDSPSLAEKYILSKIGPTSEIGGTIAHYVI